MGTRHAFARRYPRCVIAARCYSLACYGRVFRIDGNRPNALGVSQRRKRKKPALGRLFLTIRIGRGERIRTSDFYLPKVALYQAELHPEKADESGRIGRAAENHGGLRRSGRE